MGVFTFPGGVHPHDHKQYSKGAPITTAPLPQRVVIPLSQHIGAPAKPLVKVGDLVKTGQMIAEPGGFVSIPMHASITGKVTKIEKFPHPAGGLQMAVEITAEGPEEWVELTDDANYLSLSPDEMKKRIAAAGVCGMGGAGFPTHVKLSPPSDKKIDTVILNGVECEPYLTSDHRLMLERGADILSGLRIIMKVLGAQRGFIGIEQNKPDAIKLMEGLVKSESAIKVVPLKVKYPQGAEKQLIYAATKRKVPNKGGLPMEVGVVVQNVGTAAAIYEAVRFQKPLVERVIAVTGSIVKKPSNFMARVGTSFAELIELCGGVQGEIGKVISGGPMMGFALSTLDTPMAKGSSGLVLMSPQEAETPPEATCLHCGRCVDICPMNLLPSVIAKSVKHGEWRDAEKAGVMDCIKCGSCAYVCPAWIQIVQWVDLGKEKITALRKAAK
jgi:Na+-translocating ferredoxin:NAD+ oxidoreductase subunit C